MQKKIRNILAFDVASGDCSVAIATNQRTIAFVRCIERNMQAESLVPLIESLLESNNISYKQLDAIALTKGPGSFTGMRVGLACAAGIHSALRIPIFKFTTLELLAYIAKRQENVTGTFTCSVAAGRDRFYCQVFHLNKQKNSYTDQLDNNEIKLVHANETPPGPIQGYGDHPNHKTITRDALFLVQLTMGHCATLNTDVRPYIQATEIKSEW